VTRARTLRFTAKRPRAWNGRYRRIPGRTSVLHVRRIGGEWWPVVDWRIDDDIGTCPMLEGGDIDELVDAVHAGKRALGASPGGSFLVNEFGQVLVPATDHETTRVVHVGDCDGPLVFQNPFDPGTTFDLVEDRSLDPGQSWDRPYVGMIYNLSPFDEICFKKTDATGSHYLDAPTHDGGLVSALRRLRPYGWIRLIVGAGGIALTKVEPDWQPHYVGRVKPARWFPKEG
jgi:hypothetical protein